MHNWIHNLHQVLYELKKYILYLYSCNINSFFCFIKSMCSLLMLGQYNIKFNLTYEKI